MILPQGVYKKLREAIISHAITPGSTLREEHLAAQLKVSRTPVREALRKLAEEGFVDYQPHKGARLLVPTAEWVREIFQIREALEGVAAREAAVKIQKARLVFIRTKFEELRPLVIAGDIHNVGGFLHKELFDASGNKSLQRCQREAPGRCNLVVRREARHVFFENRSGSWIIEQGAHLRFLHRIGRVLRKRRTRCK